MNCAVLTRNFHYVDVLNRCFSDAAFVWHHFEEEAQLLRTLRRQAFDLIVIDAGVTGSIGASILGWRRCHSNHYTPIVMLTSFARKQQLHEALEVDADEIIASPPETMEVCVRIRRALRRALPEKQQHRIHAGAYCIERDAGAVWLGDLRIDLTGKEFALAYLLFSNLGICLSRAQIAAAVWGSDIDLTDHTLEQHIYKLRKKLLLSDASGIRLRTVYSLGYKLEKIEGADSAPHSMLSDISIPYAVA